MYIYSCGDCIQVNAEEILPFNSSALPEICTVYGDSHLESLRGREARGINLSPLSLPGSLPSQYVKSETFRCSLNTPLSLTTRKVSLTRQQWNALTFKTLESVCLCVKRKASLSSEENMEKKTLLFCMAFYRYRSSNITFLFSVFKFFASRSNVTTVLLIAWVCIRKTASAIYSYFL